MRCQCHVTCPLCMCLCVLVYSKGQKSRRTALSVAGNAAKKEKALLKADIVKFRHKQGEAFSEDENRVALTCFLNLRLESREQKELKSDNQHIQRVAQLLSRSKESVRKLVSKYKDDGTVLFYPTQNRGRGSPKWVYFVCVPIPLCLFVRLLQSRNSS